MMEDEKLQLLIGLFGELKKDINDVKTELKTNIDDEMGPLLQEVEAGQRPEWKDIADRNPTYKGYWAQWKSLVVRDGVLERLWECADGTTKTAQVVIPRSKVKEVLTEMHGWPSGGHLGVNKTLAKVRQRYYWLHSRDDVESWCRQCDTCGASRGPPNYDPGPDAPVQRRITF
jgi:hypothetical protein